MMMPLAFAFTGFHVDFGQIALLLWIGSRATVFYRRRFGFGHVRPLLDMGFLGLAILIQRLEEQKVQWRVSVAMSISEALVRTDSSQEILKSIILACSFYLAYSETVSSLTWISLCIVAATQLLRWPNSLKIALRDLRTLCGPSYAILIIGAFLKEKSLFRSSSDPTQTLLKILQSVSLLGCAATSSFLASVLFRPDNQQLWTLLPNSRYGGWIPSARMQKFIHATLMIVSFVCMIAKFLVLEYKSPLRVVGFCLIFLSCVGLVMGVRLISELLISFKVKRDVLI